MQDDDKLRESKALLSRNLTEKDKKQMDKEHSTFTEGESSIKDEFTRYEGQSDASIIKQSF